MAARLGTGEEPRPSIDRRIGRTGNPTGRRGPSRKTLCVSRSRLYNAFADGDGVAASIRDARLDRARRYLSMPAHAHESIATLMVRCGFTDASRFSRAFRRRFGISARDARPRSMTFPV